MKRLFTFGCSLTEYQWATWADILCLHLCQEGYETYNYGNSGMGNEHVLQAMVAADLKHTFTDDDIICVLWTSWTREDRIWENNCWGKNGNIITADEERFKNFMKFFSLENYIMKNITAIRTANRAYNINYQSTLCPNETIQSEETDDKLLDTFLNMEDILDKFSPEHITTDLQRDIRDSTPILNRIDGHPTPQLHNIFLKNHVLPALGIDRLHPTANAWAVKWQGYVQEINARLKTEPDWNYRGDYGDLKREQTKSYMKSWEDLWENDIMGIEKGIHNMLLRFKEVK